LERLTQHLAAAVALAALASLPALGVTQQYTLEIKDRQRISYELEIAVTHPGTLAMEAVWDSSRMLTFRFEGPGAPLRRIRRSGPSPMRLEIEVAPDSPHLAEVWKLNIMGLAASGGCRVDLTLEVPDPPWKVREEEEERAIAAAPPKPVIEPKPWMISREPSTGLSEDRVHLHSTVEKLRSEIVLPGWKTAIDSCRWQTDFMRYATVWRDRTAAESDLPDISTRRFLLNLSEVVRKVDKLRNSDDPVLAGPMPPPGEEQRPWLSLRRTRIMALESEMDQLLDNLKSGFAPRLESEIWPQRFIICLMACERFFEERVRVGDDKASNRDLAGAQWDTVLAAADAMEALASLSVIIP